ncbi:helix-turn-helix transcriptional regulator [Streptomyces sp. NPDC007083]|uniref:helix-turn-helix domain-containing protein n=1 Tax=Streptomyces sp. NPDC007083 TaxID=3156913 RepID=UPI0033CB3F37
MNPLPVDLFARRLRQEREHQGISQAELARRIADILGTNVDPSAVTRIEQQMRAVRLDEAVAAAQALGVPLVFLLNDDPTAEEEAELQRYLAEYALAQRQWEKSRREMLRLTRIIQTITGGTDLQALLDARGPVEDQEEGGGGSTDPDA